MSVKWTDQQSEAITSRGENILVAAAAGSGKTAVLVERIIRKITDSENPVSVDKLLVLTFTEAAASEMKRKISDAIDKKIEENPKDEWLRQQSMRVGSACISTIHSFCRRIITNNAHLTDLPADFTMIDDTENCVLKDSAVNEVLEAFYKNIDKQEGFAQLAEGFGGVKNDLALREIILKMYEFSQSLAYPNRWFKAVRDSYRKVYLGGAVADSSWCEPVTELVCEYVSDISNIMDILCDIADREFMTDDYQEDYHKVYFDTLRDNFNAEIEACGDLRTNEGRVALKLFISTFKLPTERNQKDYEPELKKRVADLKKMINEKKKSAAILEIFGSEETERLGKCYPSVRALCNVVRMTARTHERMKRERGCIDFSDLEHGLLRLICNAKGEETPLCGKLRDTFDEILLDEFQDTNNLQFEIFSRISKKEGNLFMVGDVKQSIYKFRNADPSIFLNLYKEYGRSNGGKLIRLFKNFRSRQEVIDSVNFVFSSIMSEKTGGIDYTEEEFLIYGADYKGDGGYNTELLIPDAVETEELSQAEAAVERIRRLVCDEKLLVTDKESGELRPVRYGDVAVLATNWSDCSGVEKALNDSGIAAVCEKSSHYLDSVEVATIMAFLQIIDNPIQDIPLIAVMRSPIFAFNGDDLAEIRGCRRKGSFYDALLAAVRDGNEKAAHFVEVLEDLRASAMYMGVDEIVRKICNDLQYISLVGAMDGGKLRIENIKLLLARCADFESGSMTGLFNFVKYIEMLKENGRDLKSASLGGDARDAVQIMTIHKSKGLEFPVVLMYGLEKGFNYTDINKGIIWDGDMGIGINYVDIKKRIRYGIPARDVVRNKMQKEIRAEQMRLLYVGMTRAKEKLIISARLHTRGAQYKKSGFDQKGRMYSVFAGSADSMREWVWGSVLRHPDGKQLRELTERRDIVPPASEDSKFDILMGIRKKEAEDVGSEEQTETLIEFDRGELKDKLDYRYEYSDLSKLPIKMSVSEMKRRRMPEEDYSYGLLKRPQSLMTDRDEMNSAEKGTVTHFVLQHMDISDTESEDRVKAQADKMAERGLITVKQREAVDTDAVFSFFDSELGRRLKAAEKYEREFDFYMLIPPTEAESGINADGADDVILQGIADCFFYTEDGIVLIDYKTDRVGKSGVKQRSEIYRIQMEYYARGLESVLGLPVKEKYLYFLNCNEAVAM